MNDKITMPKETRMAEQESEFNRLEDAVSGEWWRNLKNELREMMDRPIDHDVFINKPKGGQR